MDSSLNSIFEQLFEAAAQSRAQDDHWIVIDCACEHLEVLDTFDYDAVLARVLKLIETYPELDYGGPGPFGSWLERKPVKAYEHALLESLARQPSTQVLGWLDRTLRIDDAEREAQKLLPKEQFAHLLEQVIAHPLAPEDCIDFARFCQQHD